MEEKEEWRADPTFEECARDIAATTFAKGTVVDHFSTVEHTG